MSENTWADRMFLGAIVTLFLGFGLLLCIDSIRHNGFGLYNSLYIFALSVGLVRSYVEIVRGRIAENGDHSEDPSCDDFDESNSREDRSSLID